MSNRFANSIKSPTGALLVSLIVVALSSVALPFVTGYGTQLCQIVVLGGWALVAAATSHTFADQNHFVLWPIVTILNLVLFSLIAAPSYFILRRRAPAFSSLFLLAWLVFYLCCLFVLFPATDGP